LGACEILRFTGDPESAAAMKRELLATSRAHPSALVHDRELRTWTPALLSNLTHYELDARRFEEARALGKEALALRRELGGPSGIAHALTALAAVAYAEQNFVQARDLFAESVSGFVADKQSEEAAASRVSVAECELLLGRLGAASEELRQALVTLREIPARMDVVYALRVAGMLAEARGEADRCVELFGAADRRQEESGLQAFGTAEAKLHGSFLERARAVLGEGAFRRAHERGSLASEDEALSLAESVANA
jgi:tetratricopeptide (TPR) repeat protein